MAYIVSQPHRKIIRNKAAELGCKYRVTADGEVHFYGTMPNTDQVGWWFYSWTPEEAAELIGQEG